MRIGVVAPASIGNKDAEAPFIAFAALAYLRSIWSCTRNLRPQIVDQRHLDRLPA